jgi:hypothetical protein
LYLIIQINGKAPNLVEYRSEILRILTQLNISNIPRTVVRAKNASLSL